MAIDWNEIYARGRDYRVMNQLLLSRILAETGKSGGKVLDIGCGTGDLVVKLAQRGYDVTGVDLSDVAIKKAQERTAEAGVENIKFLVLNVADPKEAKRMELESEQYDLITCKLVFTFMPDQASFFKWVKARLAPDGCFVLITPVLNSHNINHTTPRLRNISVNNADLKGLFKGFFNEVKELHTEYFDDWGEEITYALK